MIFVVGSIACLSFVSNIFASSIPLFAKKVLKFLCFLLFVYCGEPVEFCPMLH